MVGILDSFRSVMPKLESFFEGKFYPPIVAFLVAAGHITGSEFYMNIILLSMAWVAFIVCRSTLFMITPLVCFIYQVTLVHSPGFPTFSDYYFKGAKLVIVLILAVITFGLIIFRFAVNLKREIDLKTPLLVSLCALSAAFLCNGAFSAEWEISDLVLGFVEAVAFLFVFYLFYFGLSGHSSDKLIDYLCYATLWIALVLIAESAFMYITYDNLISLNDGSIIKDNINLGWGISNPIAASMAVLIPVLIYGAMRMKYPIIYFAVAFLTYIGSVVTMSRNALIFATLVLLVSLVIGCFKGKRKIPFIITTIVCILCALCGITLLWSRISELFSSMIEQGFADNGRFNLWRMGYENFLAAPIFGKGFFGFGDAGVFEAASFIPTTAHNTVIQLLSSMGIIGLIFYCYYRVESLVPLVRKPSLAKTMLYLSIFVLVGMSLLDSFIFFVYPMYYANIALAIIFRIDAEEKSALFA